MEYLILSNQSDLLDHLYDHGMDLRQRRIYLQSAFWETYEKENQFDCENAIRSIQYLDKTDGDIEVWVNTPGGSVIQMLALYDVIQACKNKIITIGHGEICSAGCLVLACGDERLATENSWFMFHSMTAGMDAIKITDAEDRMNATQKMNEQWFELMSKHTNHSKNFWKAKTSGEFWLSAKEMLQKQHGIIDGIYGED